MPTSPHGWGLRARLRFGFGGLLLLLLLVSGLSIAALTHYNRTFERAVHESYGSVVYCDAMASDLDDLNRDALARLFANQPLDRQQTLRLQQDFERNANLQLHNAFLSGEADDSQRILQTWSTFKAEYDRLAATAPGGGEDARAAYGTSLLPQHRRLLELIRHVSATNLRQMTTVDRRVRDTLAAAQSFSFLLTGVGLLLGLGFIATISGAILSPLSALTRSARRIADGHLDDPTIPVRSDDEVGHLADAFNQMAARLREFRRLDLERLERTRQTTRMAIDSLPDAIAVLNPAGHIELVNRTARERFGWSPAPTHAPAARVASATTSSPPSSATAPIPPWMSALHQEVMRTKQPVEPQTYKSAIQQFHQGDERFYLPHATPLLSDGDAHPLGVTVILSDVTNLKAADEARSDLVSTVSHELKTPLTSIRMAVHMLADHDAFGPLAPRQLEILRTARDNTERLFRTVEHLLSIDRLQSGRAPLQLTAVPAATLIDQALDPMLLNFAARDIRVTRQCPPDAATAQAHVDPTVIPYVLTNLLTNALKYAPQHSEVRITCHVESPFLRVTVEDEGAGIPPENLPHLFDRFFRAPVGTTPPGAGLGLAIAREIVQAHQGTLTAHNRADGKTGASFTFTLPLAQPNTELH